MEQLIWILPLAVLLFVVFRRAGGSG